MLSNGTPLVSAIGRVCTGLLALVALILITTACANGQEVEEEPPAFIDPAEASTYPGYELQGEYVGSLQLDDNGEEQDVGLQLAVYGSNEFRALLYHEGLPGERSEPYSDDEMMEMEGTYQDAILRLEGDRWFEFEHANGTLIALGEDGDEIGQLEKVQRESPTLGMEPPEGAIVLFDGTNLDHWDENTRMTDDGLLMQGARTTDAYADKRLHVEAMLGFMPESGSQSRANSGIYIQNRYEVQILDSFGLPLAIYGNGSLYNESAPIVNTTYPPLTWQTYDVFFRAPRFDEDGNKTENARVTAYLNGVLVQDDVELEQGTGAGGEREEVPRAELYLQDHTGPVRFRNVWLVEGEHSPPGVEVLSFSE